MPYPPMNKIKIRRLSAGVLPLNALRTTRSTKKRH